MIFTLPLTFLSIAIFIQKKYKNHKIFQYSCKFRQTFHFRFFIVDLYSLKRKEVLRLITCPNEIEHTDIQNCIIGNKCGTITISVYQETISGTHIFHVQPDNEEILPICYVVEDALSVY